MVWDRYAQSQPAGPTIDLFHRWWQDLNCESYYLEFWKKSLDEQIEGLFSETAAKSCNFAQEWQGALAVADAATAHEARIALQVREDAAEA